MAIGRIPEPGTGIPESIIAAKGDILTGTANDVPAVLTAGANETRLVADSSTATGLKYVADTTNYAIAAKGNLLVGTAADTLAALTVGTNGHTLVADSAETTGLKWAAPAGGGKVLQVVSATTTTLKNIATTTQTDTNITATITPTSATSKILVLISACFRLTRNANGLYTGARLQRGATSIADFGDYKFAHLSVEASSLPTRVDLGGNYSITYLDNPATTSATTYKVQAKVELTTNSAAIDYQYGDGPSTITLLEIGA